MCKEEAAIEMPIDGVDILLNKQGQGVISGRKGYKFFPLKKPFSHPW